MTKLLSGLLTQDSYKSVCSRVCWGTSLGTILVYLIAPVLMKLLHWKAVFLFCGICGIGVTILWSFKCPEYTHQAPAPASGRRENTGSGRLISPLILALMAAILLQGMLRDGITTWMPAYVAEVYHLDNYLSVLVNVFLPVFGIVCLEVSTRLYRFHIKNPVTCAAFFFCLGAVASAALADRFVWGVNLVSWLVVSVLGSGLCLLSIRPWQKQYMDHQ